MISSFAYSQFMGLSVAAYVGMLTFLLVVITAVLGYFSLKGIGRIKLGSHKAFAIITILVALFHAFLILSGKLKY